MEKNINRKRKRKGRHGKDIGSRKEDETRFNDTKNTRRGKQVTIHRGKSITQAWVREDRELLPMMT